MLSLMYSDGLGVEQDMRQARLLSEAAVKNELKVGIAETNLGWWYLTGESGHPKDLQLAHEWNRQGAKAGPCECQRQSGAHLCRRIGSRPRHNDQSLLATKVR